MKKLWALNRAFHLDAADRLLERFNLRVQVKTRRLATEKQKLGWHPWTNSDELELRGLQDLTVYHMAEAFKYSALLDGSVEKDLPTH